MKELSIREGYVTLSTTTNSFFLKNHRENDHFNMTNFYIPTLNPKKYNPLKLKELMMHKNHEK
jgi:hypothetical protein